MRINEVLKDFVKECSEELELMSVIQFGSSTHDKNPNDIDLILFSKGEVFSSENYIKLLKIINDFEKKYKEVVFDIGAGLRLRKGKYKISIVPQQKLDLKLGVDIFFINNLYKDKDKKILFGKNPFSKRVNINNKKIISKIILEVNFALRKCLDNETKDESINFLFKSVLRLMLLNEEVSRKDDLLERFKFVYPKISLPENSKKILYKQIEDKDIGSVLAFSEICINNLINQHR